MNNNEFGEFLRELRGKLSLREASKKSGISHTYIRDLELGINRKTNAPIIPSLETLKRLSDAYSYPFADLLAKSGIMGDVSTISRTEDSKKKTSGLIEYPNGKVGIGVSEVSEHYNILRIPLLGCIPAGEPIEAHEHIEKYIDIPNTLNLKNDEVFALRVKGDSMIGSRIQEGDVVIVKKQPVVENGEIAVVNIDGHDATLKRVKKLESGQTILVSSNEKYDPILINNENARIIGKVIQVIFEP